MQLVVLLFAFVPSALGAASPRNLILSANRRSGGREREALKEIARIVRSYDGVLAIQPGDRTKQKHKAVMTRTASASKKQQGPTDSSAI